VDVVVLIAAATSRERLRAVELGAEVGFEHRLVIEPVALADTQWDELERREREFSREVTRDGIEVRALLLLEGLEARTHAGVLRMVAERLVRAGKLEPKVNVLLAKLQGIRHESDYGYAFDIDPEDARQGYEEARAFVERTATRVAAEDSAEP